MAKRRKADVTWNAANKMWFIRRFDTIGIVKRVGGLFCPARLGVHGNPCKRLADAVAWVERREARQGIDEQH